MKSQPSQSESVSAKEEDQKAEERKKKEEEFPKISIKGSYGSVTHRHDG
jgi:hypothetical protein